MSVELRLQFEAIKMHFFIIQQLWICGFPTIPNTHATVFLWWKQLLNRAVVWEHKKKSWWIFNTRDNQIPIEPSPESQKTHSTRTHAHTCANGKNKKNKTFWPQISSNRNFPSFITRQQLKTATDTNPHTHRQTRGGWCCLSTAIISICCQCGKDHGVPTHKHTPPTNTHGKQPTCRCRHGLMWRAGKKQQKKNKDKPTNHNKNMTESTLCGLCRLVLFLFPLVKLDS